MGVSIVEPELLHVLFGLPYDMTSMTVRGRLLAVMLIMSYGRPNSKCSSSGPTILRPRSTTAPPATGAHAHHDRAVVKVVAAAAARAAGVQPLYDSLHSVQLQI